MRPSATASSAEHMAWMCQLSVKRRPGSSTGQTIFRKECSDRSPRFWSSVPAAIARRACISRRSTASLGLRTALLLQRLVELGQVLGEFFLSHAHVDLERPTIRARVLHLDLLRPAHADLGEEDQRSDVAVLGLLVEPVGDGQVALGSPDAQLGAVVLAQG